MSTKSETSNFSVSQRFYIWLDCFRLTKHTVFLHQKTIFQNILKAEIINYMNCILFNSMLS